MVVEAPHLLPGSQWLHRGVALPLADVALYACTSEQLEVWAGLAAPVLESARELPNRPVIGVLLTRGGDDCPGATGMRSSASRRRLTG